MRKIAYREIKLLSELKSPNVVHLIEVFLYQEKINLVFEFVQNNSLELIQSRPEGLNPLFVKKLMWQLLKSLEFLHTHNAIHRDIKPENLLISKNGALKLCDFGFARYLNNLNQEYTDYVSTRWYRAPELLVGDVNYSKPVDIWSVGCMLCELSNGKPIFPGDSDTEMIKIIIEVLGQNLTSKQKKALEINKYITENNKEIVYK